MNPQSVFCPNLVCPARGQQGQGNISVHSQKERRYGCAVCQQTFSVTKGTLFYRLRTDSVQVMLVITLLAYGCPRQAIVQAFGFLSVAVAAAWAAGPTPVGDMVGHRHRAGGQTPHGGGPGHRTAHCARQCTGGNTVARQFAGRWRHQHGLHRTTQCHVPPAAGLVWPGARVTWSRSRRP